MEQEPGPYSEVDSPSLGDMLALVGSGNAEGFTIMVDGECVGYAIFEPGETIDWPIEDETWVPIAPEHIQELLDNLLTNFPKDLVELGRLALECLQDLN